MNPDQIFSVCSKLALIGWIILIFLKFWQKRDQFVYGIIIILLAAVYSWLIFASFDKDIFKNFSTLTGVANLFADKNMLLAGWIHYLAFDLLAGIYIIKNAEKNNINHWLTTPTLLLTFLFGPFGLLLYILLRSIITRNFFSAY
ncbi:MAG TPA: ABA4-like family protein [Flavisolibacter sp.]|nr:ABA4-like family protein [Flavisolibacter sp.]